MSSYQLNPPKQKGVNLEGLGGWEYIQYVIKYVNKQINKYDYLKKKTKNKNKNQQNNIKYMEIIIIIVSHVCSSSLLRVSWGVLCSMSFLFEYMCTRLPFISWSIAGVLSSQALPGYLLTAPPSVCIPAVIGVLAVWTQQQQQKTKKERSYY